MNLLKKKLCSLEINSQELKATCILATTGKSGEHQAERFFRRRLGQIGSNFDTLGYLLLLLLFGNLLIGIIMLPALFKLLLETR